MFKLKCHRLIILGFAFQRSVLINSCKEQTSDLHPPKQPPPAPVNDKSCSVASQLQRMEGSRFREGLAPTQRS